MVYSTKNSMQRISDVIGEDYKKWKDHSNIFITAPTGSGKTYFVLNVLLPYVAQQKKKMVYFVNRKILQEQLKKEIADFPLEYQAAIDIETYQSLELDIVAHMYRELSFTYPQTAVDQKEFSDLYIHQEGPVFYYPLDSILDPLITKYHNSAQKSEDADRASTQPPKKASSSKPYGEKKYDYAVCDECHYFLTDSNYNTNTILSFGFIMEYFNDKTTLFMSATINDIKKYIQSYCNDRKFYSTDIYHFPSKSVNSFKLCSKCVPTDYEVARNYDYLDIHVIQNDTDSIINCVMQDSNTKWLIFVDSINYGREIESRIKEAFGNKSEQDKGEKTRKKDSNTVLFLSSDSLDEENTQSGMEEITTDGKFRQRVLIATSIMDNGVNITDREVRNIILIADTETEFIQMLGRKRQDGKKTQLYIIKQNKNHFRNRLAQNREIRSAITSYMKALITNIKNPVSDSYYNDIQYYNAEEYKVVNKYQGILLPALLGRSRSSLSLRRTLYSYNGLLLINMLAYQNLENLNIYYQGVIDSFEREGEDAFIKRQLSWLGRSMSESDEIIAEYSLTSKDKVIAALEKNEGKKLTIEENKALKDSILNELKILINESEPKDKKWEDEKKIASDSFAKKGDRALSAPIMNYLRECCGIPYEMKCVRGNSKEGRSTYYVIKKSKKDTQGF